MASNTVPAIKKFPSECPQVQQDTQSATSAHCTSLVPVCTKSNTRLAAEGAPTLSAAVGSCNVPCNVLDKTGGSSKANASSEKAKINLLRDPKSLAVSTGKDGLQTCLEKCKQTFNQGANFLDSASGAPIGIMSSSGGVAHSASLCAAPWSSASDVTNKSAQESPFHASRACNKPKNHRTASVVDNPTFTSSDSSRNTGPVVLKDEPVSPPHLDSPSVSSRNMSALATLSGLKAVCSNRQVALPCASSENIDLSGSLLPAMFSTDRLAVQPAMQRPDTPCLNATAFKNASFVKCECGFGPVDLGAMEKHIMGNHVKPFSHGCELCDRKFSTRRELKGHFICHMHIQENFPGHDTSDVVSDPCDLQQADPNLNPAQEHCLSGAVKLYEANLALGSYVGEGESYEVRHEPSHLGPVNATGSMSHWLLRRDLVGSKLLLSFFKCTVGQCKYTGTRAADFYNHLTSHKLTEMRRLLCIYCGKLFDAIAVLVQHMESAHRHLIQQCGHCLYRSKLPIHVQLHHKHFHANEKLLVFVCTDAEKPTALANIPSQRVSLTHYWCTTSGCGFKCFNPDVFEWHLSTLHPKAEKYTCFICDLPSRSPQALVQHCVGHDMDVVQCGICHHSEPTYEKMLKHLCDYHFDSPLHLTFRTDRLAEEFRKFMVALQSDPEQCIINFVSQEAVSMEEQVHQSTVPCVTASDNSLGTSSALSTPQSTKPCPFCPDLLVTLAELTKHCIVVHNISLRISETLELMLKRKNTALAMDKCLFCPFCSLTFLDKEKLQEHMFLEFHYLPVQCGACGHSTLTEAHLRQHFLSTHPQRPPAFTICKNEDFEAWVENFISQQEARCYVVEKPYQCAECKERCGSASELRLHICSHLKYYPYHCRICDECFMSQEEVERHQRVKHNVLGQYSTQEVRFETKELKIDGLIEAATRKVQELLENSPTQQCLWKGCLCKPSSLSELALHVKQHIEQRKTCGQCHFSSYSADVVAWHTREQHSPVSSSTEIPSTSAVSCHPPPASLRLFACSFCSYKGHSSQSIREHSKVKHPGKAAKFVAPRRKDFQALTSKVVESAEKRKEECCSEQLHISLARPKQDALCVSRRFLKKQEFKCSVCNFLASSEHLLHLHKLNFHRGRQSLTSRPDAIAKALCNTILQLATCAESSIASSETLTSVQATGSVPRSSPSVSSHECYKCSIYFDSKESLFGHMVVKHHMHAVCDACGRGLMNNTAAFLHVGKHTPESTFTILRSYLHSVSPNIKVHNTINPSTHERPLEHTAEIYVVPPCAGGTRVPLREFGLQCNLNVHVQVKDIKKLPSLT
ncbi:uncharacterized protein LOC144132957 [Amblyomma americanum]